MLRAVTVSFCVAASICILAYYELIVARRLRRAVNRVVSLWLGQKELYVELRASAIEKETLMAARIAAEKVNARAKTELITMVSHEVRTPLNAVTGAAALLATTPLSAEQRELMHVLNAGSSHLCTVIDDLLNFAALEKGSIEIKEERVNLVRTASRVLPCCVFSNANRGGAC